ncbi:MAG: ribosomal L7Ae/L30e/S12e/Gadd45 family protein [Oscillospiraceae bacterium]|jgi:ribosomal protein L7Ae-like RNA K-turn-binding protein|nr:ribosomal L7Ae/L30e/S12e/Gadd45 family protein [Oscillospiraceae bacterium]
MSGGVFGLLGMCYRAGRLAVGADPALESIAKKKARLCVICSDSAENTRSKITLACKNANVPLISADFTKFELSQALPRGTPAVVTIEDEGFAAGITRAMNK